MSLLFSVVTHAGSSRAREVISYPPLPPPPPPPSNILDTISQSESLSERFKQSDWLDKVS